jgi:hypothetical protein
VRGKPQAVPTVPTAKKRGGNTAGGQPQALRGFAKPVPTVPTKKVKDHSHIPAVSPAPPLLDSQNHQKMVGTVGTVGTVGAISMAYVFPPPKHEWEQWEQHPAEPSICAGLGAAAVHCSPRDSRD